jgi:DNA-directed RNA polymerase specialized sigma24 family protein
MRAMSKIPRAAQAPATTEEIEKALAALTEAQLVRFGKVSAFRIASLGTRAVGRNPGDILSDAIIAVLEGRRKWIRTKVDFVPFLLGVMKSLTSHIRTGKPLDAFDEIAPNPVNEEDDGEDFVEQIPTTAPVDPERQLFATDLDQQIRERFNDDPEVLLVYEAFLEKMRPAEIQNCLGLSEKEYNAAAKRLRRAVERLAEGGLR